MTFAAQQFNDLVREHQSMVFSLALRVVGERGTAEEVAQDVFLELYRSAAKVENAEHAKFWLRRVAVHRATDALRRRKVRPDQGAEEFVEEFGSPSDVRWGDAATAMAVEARLDELLGSLPEAFRVAVVLRYQEDMLPEEMAAVLGQPLATVKSNLRRGLEMMRRKAAVTMKGYVR